MIMSRRLQHDFRPGCEVCAIYVGEEIGHGIMH
jgi:hypothetical protein